MNLSFIKKAAPWIGAVVGTAVPAAGPFISIASKLLTSGLGKDVKPDANSIKTALETAMGTPEELAKLKEIDDQFAVQMKQLEINSVEDFEKLAAADRADARAMEIKTGSKVPAILAMSVTVGFFALLSLIALHACPVGSEKVMDVMTGALGAAWLAIVNYYFGSSAGSARKTELLSQPDKT